MAPPKGPRWYSAEYEYDYSEMLVLIALVVLAVCFEAAWHGLMRKAEGSYSFGRVESLVNDAPHSLPFGTAENQQLFRELVNRAGGEFMTLGFLSACVYFFRQGGGFDAVAEISSKDVWPYPESGDVWLHLAEDTEFILFFAMVFYFILQARLVSGAVWHIRIWEQLRLKRIMPNFDDMPGVPHLKVSHTLTAEYASLRRYFSLKMVEWQRKRPSLFHRLIQELQLNTEDEDFDQKFYDLLESDLAFSGYLAASVESGVRDSIQVHVSTWLVLLASLLLFTMVDRACHVAFLQTAPVLVVLTALTMIIMRLLVRRTRRKIADRVALEEAGCTRTSTASFGHMLTTTSSMAIGSSACHYLQQFRRWFREAHRTEFIIMRFLQMVLFLISYLFSRLLLDFHDWQAQTYTSLTYAGLFFLLFVALAVEVKNSGPLFLAMTSLPPYMDRKQFRLFGAVLLQGREAQYQSEVAHLKAKSLHGGTGDLSEVGDSGTALGDLRGTDAKDDFLPPSTENTPRGASRDPHTGGRRPTRSSDVGSRLVDQQGEFFLTFIALARQRGMDNDKLARGIRLHLRRPVPGAVESAGSGEHGGGIDGQENAKATAGGDAPDRDARTLVGVVAASVRTSQDVAPGVASEEWAQDDDFLEAYV